MTEPEALNIVHKWLNEDTGNVPRKEIAELCVEIRMLGERNRELEAENNSVISQCDNLAADANELRMENQRLKDFDLAAVIAGRKIRTHCAHWSVDAVLDEVIASHNKYFRQAAEGKGDE